MSAQRLTLRQRVALASTLLGSILSMLFAFATVQVADDYEMAMVEEILRSQAQTYGTRDAETRAMTPPRTRRINGYFRSTDGITDVPAAYADLAPGFHEAGDESGTHVGVFDTDRGRLYFSIKMGDIERLENHLNWALAAVIVLGTTLSGWLGWFIAGSTLAPVRRLAGAVDALSTRPRMTALAALQSNDELGRLAIAIDRYQARLVDADLHERAFFTDANHELRTPLAVVRGAADVLFDEPSADPCVQRKLKRLDRALQQLNDLLNVLLGMARRREPVVERVDAGAVVLESLSSLVSGAEGAHIDVDFDVAGHLHLPRGESVLLLRSAIRQVVLSETPGRLAVSLRGSVIDLSFDAQNGIYLTRNETAAVRSDEGLALTLVGRLAKQLGWRFQLIESDVGRAGLRVHLPISAID